jgi:hypothetical protein
MIVIGLTGRLSDRRSCVMAIRVWRLFGGFSGRVRWIHAVGSAAAMIFPGRCSGRDGAELGEVRVEWRSGLGGNGPSELSVAETARLAALVSLGRCCRSLAPARAAHAQQRHAQHNASPYAPQCTQCTDAEPTPPLHLPNQSTPPDDLSSPPHSSDVSASTIIAVRVT